MNRRALPPGIFRQRRGALTRRHSPNLYTTMLLLQLVDRLSSLNPKPPVTVLLITLNLSIFYFPLLATHLPLNVTAPIRPFLSALSPRAACLSPATVLSQPSQRPRVLLAAFAHLSDTHVVYNSLSLLYKGVTLETSLGSLSFLALVLYLALTSHLLYILIAVLLRNNGIPSTFHACIAGFSGVLFGMKVVLNSNPRHVTHAARIFRFPFPFWPPPSIAPWSELLVASILMPRVSFLGHLCGIFAGLLYVYVPILLNRLVVAIAAVPVLSPLHAATYRPFQGYGRRLHQD